MQLTIKNKTFNIWSKKRILYTICFFLFCVIDQRTKTGSGLDGIIETFRDMAGVLMAVIIMSHYKWEEFMAYKIPYAVWRGIGLVAGVLFVVLGQPLAYFMNERVMVSLDVFLFGYVVIHTFISVVKEKKYPKLNRGMFGLWVVMMLLMIFSRSDYVWPFCYFIMFGCFYLTDFTEEEQEDLYQGIMNGVIFAFFAFQAFCCVFRPYDQVRYTGIYNNCNLNGMFYLVVLAAVFGKILYVTKENKHKFWRVYYWLGAGVVYSFIFMTIGRTVWLVSFILGLLFLGFYQGVKKKKHYFRNGLLLMLCICMMFPVTFGMTRYLPPVFHHPVWFWGEWSEQKVHSWDAWNSEKYVDINEIVESAIGRTTVITDKIFGASPFVIMSYAAELTREERAVLKTYEEYSNPFIVRKTIYNYYLHHLNFFGHPQSEQGFQLVADYWIGHAHNIYLQYSTDFGICMGACFVLLALWSIVRLAMKEQRGNIESDTYLLLLLIPLLFGMLEYSWGSGAITIILVFFAWKRAMVMDIKMSEKRMLG